MRVPALIAAALALGACSATHPAAAPSVSPARPAASASSSPRTAGQYAAALKARLPRVRRVIVLNEDTDPSNMLGRPGGFTSAAVLVDPQGERCPRNDLGVQCGAKIEVWPTAQDAARRAKFVQDQLKQNPAFGTEYDYPGGPALLRVHGTVKPSAARTYERVWRQITG